MKLLLDQNLSPRLCEYLSDLGATIMHVRDFGLETEDDAKIWTYSAEQDFIIVTKDSDFNHRAFLFGPPPKVVWIRLGNCGTREIEGLLRSHQEVLETFAADASSGLLILE